MSWARDCTKRRFVLQVKLTLTAAIPSIAASYLYYQHTRHLHNYDTSKGPASRMTAQRIYDTVADDFSRVNDLIIQRLSSDVPLVEKIAQYIIESGGKRLRPLLVLLSSRAAGYNKDEHLKLAAVIEFLHTATLLHDDVVDTSDMRRGRSTANAKWGNAPSVLVGDFLYARAFEMMVELQSLPIMNVLSHATAVIAQGEVMQLMNIKNPDLSEDQYMAVIHNKTAMLFEAAAHSGALLASADDAQEQALKNYGKHLGLAFQLVDDVLDYRGDAEAMGKNVGDDLAEGKTTLPLIHAMENSNEEDRQLIRQAIRKGGLDDLSRILKLVEASGALEYTMERARAEAAKASDTLNALAASPHKEALELLTQVAVARVS
ncbi:octaprenyl-diphosphate synthase [Marinobacter antarcticus]|uniref:Octaprenyl diphosphate synthase n=2 Tax=Marinobacter antarcticus TaxID=564117 RepID=A0A1M6VVP1_9GAMM|nr:octaprenyl-diphosphate synthase [Marinobacter antarcticus]